jgi:amphi-Trp domain-containing protein
VRRRAEKVVSDVKVEQKQTLSRQEAARFIQALADGLGDDGRVTIQLGTSTLELSVASQVDCELEVAVDGDEIELELELKWSISGRPSSEAAQHEPAADELDEDEVENDLEEEEPGEDAVGGDDTGEGESEQEVAAEDEAADGASVEEAAGSSEAESVSAVTPEETARPRRGRRKAAAEAGKRAFNGVDTAAVRAWAAANGVSVSPRGRIKDELIEAYRAAGN